MAVDDDGYVRRQTREVTMLDQITPLILTFNEATNIARTLEAHAPKLGRMVDCGGRSSDAMLAP